MTRHLHGILVRLATCSLVAAMVTVAVAPAVLGQEAPPKAVKPPDSPLFKSEALFDVTLKMNIKTVKKDKGDKAPWRAATLSYADADAPGGNRVVPLRVRTRGVWRLKNCEFPPLRFNFANKEVRGSVWHDLDQPKLVSYCKSLSNYEQYVLQEYQIYRIYRLLTPVSHQVRLMRMTYADSATGKVENTKYAFLIEDPASVAARAGGKMLEEKGAGPDDLDPEPTTLTYLFQYMIGNTDFSMGGLHNAELLVFPNGTYQSIAYDFDFAGAIDASYATPDPSLIITRVRDRLYRGFCQDNALVPKVAEQFKAKKEAIYALYSDPIGALMSPKVVKETLAYFDGFYATLDSQKEIERKILRDCRKL